MAKLTPEESKARREKFKALGLCQQECGRARVNATLCGPCTSKKLEYQRNHISKGLCRFGCGRPLYLKYRTCRECGIVARDRSKERRTRLLSSGLCTICGSNPLFNTHCCRPCYLRTKDLKYGMALGTFEKMLEESMDCRSCGEKMLLECFNSMKSVHIDHDHNTGEVRGLLCRGCNVALGQVQDDPEKLRKLADYIEKYKTKLAA